MQTYFVLWSLYIEPLIGIKL